VTLNNDWLQKAHQRREAETHPHLKRSFIPTKRIESQCIDALCQHNLLPKEPGPVRVDRLLEKKWGIVENYITLPHGVLGAAGFDRRGLRQVAISDEFDGSADITTERRGRATIAHELGHGLLHEELWQEYFEAAAQPDLFGASATAPVEGSLVQMCRDATINAINFENSYFQWWEFQANLAMGFLLVPTLLLKMALERYRKGFMEGCAMDGFNSDVLMNQSHVIADLADIFNVSKSLLRCRLKGLPGLEDYRISV
jgi:hypothetical protein